MAEQFTPTKGNLIKAKKQLAVSDMGYELLDRKRNILIREMMGLIDAAKKIGKEISRNYAQAYDALQTANITLGIVDKIAESIPAVQNIEISHRSVMGVELPQVAIKKTELTAPYGFYLTNSELDKAFVSFNRVKEMTVTLAEVESGIHRLAVVIKKTQKRANALKNILIPRFSQQVKTITSFLEEKEREEFSYLKVVKKRKEMS